MSKELDAALIDIIQSTKEGVKTGLGFLQQQLPDIIQQLLMWELYSSIFWGVFQLCIAFGLFYVAYKVSKREMTGYWDYWDKYFPSVSLYVVSIPFIFSFLFNVATVIKISIAPKIFLMEYAAHLVK